KLRNIAKARGWPIQNFGSRGTPTMWDYTRTIYATGALVGAFAAGLPIWALTRSQREAMNFSTGLFGDLAAAIAGIDLDVYGERNLWTSRPCIFIFNHQSKADVVIMAKLIRRDMGGVGKKEIRDTPIIGKLMEWAGTVFVDRADGQSAIKAMEPLVDAIRIDGKSICIAPEGTRTLTPKLAPFKKGAFHLAMQAGVPIVPVVIHNAADVAPKNEFVMRPATVRVDVLPPVDTSGWKRTTLNRHVADVRNLFLKCLGQPEESVADSIDADAEGSEAPAPAPKAAPKSKPKPTAKTAAGAAPAKKRGRPTKVAAAPKTAAKRRPVSPGPGKDKR
ncbi:MAG: hypothetical protein RLZZ58_1903, partial [Pseudomonadota bacterium]